MRDQDVRQALRKKVFAEHLRDPRTLVVEEFGVSHGAARVDVAVVNGRLHGYEIKSDADTLTRLGGQIVAYNAVFDRVTIVVGKRHLADAAEQVPAWWGIKVATSGARGAVSFHDERSAKGNPAVDPFMLAHLLWREEALDLLLKSGAKGIKSKNREQLYRMIADGIPLGTLRESVRAALKARVAWRSDAQRVPDAG